jgi:hypothetical protein
MKDKYLGKEGIEEKYDSRLRNIKIGQIAGIALGSFYSLFHIAHNFMSTGIENIKDIRDMSAGVIIGISSYLIGDYLKKRDENKREKALNNLEKELEAYRK